MDKNQIIIVITLIIFVAYKLYKRYGNNKKIKTTTNDKSSTGSKFLSTGKEDDYEPYSKK
jgi:hypothetical protein